MGHHEFLEGPERGASSKVGTIGWAALGTFVLAWDIFAPETLSGAVDRALDHPVGRIAAIGGVAVTGAHLLNLLPEAVDPFVKAFDYLERVRDYVSQSIDLRH